MERQHPFHCLCLVHMTGSSRAGAPSQCLASPHLAHRLPPPWLDVHWAQTGGGKGCTPCPCHTHAHAAALSRARSPPPSAVHAPSSPSASTPAALAVPATHASRQLHR